MYIQTHNCLSSIVFMQIIANGIHLVNPYINLDVVLDFDTNVDIKATYKRHMIICTCASQKTFDEGIQNHSWKVLSFCFERNRNAE